MKVDNNESLILAPPTKYYNKLINKIFKINVNEVWWMLANPFAKIFAYFDYTQAIRDKVSSLNLLVF